MDANACSLLNTSLILLCVAIGTLLFRLKFIHDATECHWPKSLKRLPLRLRSSNVHGWSALSPSPPIQNIGRVPLNTILHALCADYYLLNPVFVGQKRGHAGVSGAGLFGPGVSSPLRIALWTRVTLGLGMCKVCTEAVHSVALWTRVTLGLGMCIVCTEAVHCVALWTRVTLGLGMCIVCTEAVHCVALWTRVTLGLGMCKVCTEALDMCEVCISCSVS